MHRYNIQLQNMETIKAACFDTRWTPKVMAKIASNAEDAIENIEQDNPDVKVFTDGSGMERKIGPAVVLYRNGRVKAEL
jgi:hypothetical protein